MLHRTQECLLIGCFLSPVRFSTENYMFAITYNSIWTPNASSSNIYLIKLTELAHMILKYKKTLSFHFSH